MYKFLMITSLEVKPWWPLTFVRASSAGQYWQVSDGPSSSLTITTDNIPLGSYTMDVVIYHYRKRDKFIPIGYASTQFCITGRLQRRLTSYQRRLIKAITRLLYIIKYSYYRVIQYLWLNTLLIVHTLQRIWYYTQTFYYTKLGMWQQSPNLK